MVNHAAKVPKKKKKQFRHSHYKPSIIKVVVLKNEKGTQALSKKCLNLFFAGSVGIIVKTVRGWQRLATD